MSYEELCKISGVEGVQKSNQLELATSTISGLTRGICRGLVINWLKAKKGGKEFWAEEKKGSEKKGLLADTLMVQKGSDMQEKYRGTTTSAISTDEPTKASLREVGLTSDEVGGNFSKTTGFGPNSAYIANTLLTSKSRYFILSLKSADSGHSVGILRDYSFWGKSSTVYLYDPNVGELKATGSDAITTLLSRLDSITYGRKYSSRYKLHAFTD